MRNQISFADHKITAHKMVVVYEELTGREEPLNERTEKIDLAVVNTGRVKEKRNRILAQLCIY